MTNSKKELEKKSRRSKSPGGSDSTGKRAKVEKITTEKSKVPPSADKESNVPTSTDKESNVPTSADKESKVPTSANNESKVPTSANNESNVSTSTDKKTDKPDTVKSESKNKKNNSQNDSLVPKKKFKFPAARIKRIMQNDNRIGKISTYAPIILGKATELFLVEFVNQAYEGVDGKKIELKDFERIIKKFQKYHFLKIVEE